MAGAWARLDAPSYESDLAAGMDMRAALPEDAPLTLEPGAQAMIETGFAMALPPGFEAQVRPRSACRQTRHHRIEHAGHD